MKVAIALVLMSLASVNSVYASDKKNKKETKRFLEVITSGAGLQIFNIVFPHDKKSLIKDSNEESFASKKQVINDSREIMTKSFKQKKVGKDYTGLRFIYGMHYNYFRPVGSKLVSKL